MVRLLLDRGGPKRAAVFLSTKHPDEVTEIIEWLGGEGFEVFRHLPTELQAEVLIGL